MKKMLPALLTVFLLLSLAGGAFAESQADKVVTGEQAKNMKNVFANLGWLADGPDTGKHLYVFFSPGCIYCKVLFDETRKRTDGIQLRWIPLAPDGSLDGLYENSGMDAVAKAFDEGQSRAGKNAERAKRIRQYTVGAIQFYLAAGLLTDSPQGLGLPTLLYSEKDTFAISIGMPSNLKEMLKNIPQGDANAADFVPAAYALADKPYKLLPLKSKTYSNTHKKTVSAFLAPFDGSPQIGSVLPGSMDLPALGVTADGYVALSLDGKTPACFLLDKDFVEKTRAAK